MDRVLNYVLGEVGSQWALGPATLLQAHKYTVHVFGHLNTRISFSLRMEGWEDLSGRGRQLAHTESLRPQKLTWLPPG